MGYKAGDALQNGRVQNEILAQMLLGPEAINVEDLLNARIHGLMD